MRAISLPSVALFLAAAAFFSFAVRRFVTSTELAPGDVERQTFCQFAPPVIPAKFQNDITYPLDLVELPDSEYATVDGPSSYLDYYKGGWSDCLNAFVRNWHLPDDTTVWNWGDGTTIPPTLTISYPLAFGNTRTRGWSQCRKQLDRLLDDRSESELRNLMLAQISQHKRVGSFQFFGIALALALAGVTCTFYLRSRFRAEIG